jgi:CheY-like chemotaxis protein
LKTTSIQTCLVVTDDPDDHHAFTEAIGKLSDNVIVLIVIDRDKALRALWSKALTADYLIIDLSMDGMEVNEFLERLRCNPALSGIPICSYGEPKEYGDFAKRHAITFFSEEYDFSELENVFRDFFKVN